jgi:hypothetical protein
MAAAINQKYSDESQHSLRGIVSQTKAQAPVMEGANNAHASAQLGAVYANQVQNFNQQYAFQMQRYNMYKQWETAKAQAENAIWGAIFNGAGNLITSAAGGAIGKRI